MIFSSTAGLASLRYGALFVADPCIGGDEVSGECLEPALPGKFYCAKHEEARLAEWRKSGEVRR